MHPGKVHPSTTGKLEACLANRAMDLGIKTTPTGNKQSIATMMQQTPTKTQGSLSSRLSSPGFDFSFAGSDSSLSNETQAIMNSVRKEAARIKSQMTPVAEKPESSEGETHQAGGIAGRRIATPKGKSGRYSDAHKAEFRRMDSIADHASVWKTQLQPSGTSLKRSNSKANLDEPPQPKPLVKTTSFKSLNMYNDLNDLRDRTHSKRVKQNRDEDAPKAAAPQSSVPTGSTAYLATKLPSAITTPTKASLARSASTKHLSASKIPSLPRTQSSYTLGSPVAPRTEGRSRYLPSLSKMTPLKSILQRRENKLAQVAATLPSKQHAQKDQPASHIPQRTPTAKQVNFTSSTKERHALQEIPSTPTTPKGEGNAPITYPKLASVDSPNVTQRAIRTPRAPSSAPAKALSRPSTAFTFTGDNRCADPTKPQFGFGFASPVPGAPKTPMTIRTVRPSGVVTSTIPSFSSNTSLDPFKIPGAFPAIAHGMSNKKRRRSESSDLSSNYASADEAPHDKGQDKENLDPIVFNTPSKSNPPSSSGATKSAQYITRASPRPSSSSSAAAAQEEGPSPAKRARTGPSLYRAGELEEKAAKKANTPATRRLQKRQAASNKPGLGTTHGKKTGGGMTLSRLSALARPKERH